MELELRQQLPDELSQELTPRGLFEASQCSPQGSPRHMNLCSICDELSQESTPKGLFEASQCSLQSSPVTRTLEEPTMNSLWNTHDELLQYPP